MLVLAIVNQKGGTGKTTTAVNLAHGLAIAGHKTLIVDLDAQGNAADVLGIRKWGGLYELLFGDAKTAITDTGRDRLGLVASDHSTVEVKSRLTGMNFREQVLRQALEALPYDAIVLDAAPGVDVLQVSALVACTHFLIPVALDHLAVVGAGDALTTTASLQKVGAFRGDFLGVLPTMWERSTRESHEQLEILVSRFTALVWPPIPQDVKAREAPSYGQTLWEYAPGTRALAGVRVNGNGKTVGGYAQVLRRLTEECKL